MFEDLLIEALNMYGPSYEGYTPLTREEAQTILRVLSVRRDNLEIMSPIMAPIPFLVEYSDTAWVTFVASVQIGAYPFLLNSLRQCFPAGYDRNQQTREGSMQRALRRFFDDYLPGLTLIDNVGITRAGRRVTDIDFAAVDKRDGTVMLFQLKHQDPYGGDIRRRSNRAERLRSEVTHWCYQANLPHCSTHGLRKAAAIRRALKRATAPELMAWFGWKTIGEAQRYIEEVSRIKLSESAGEKMRTGIGSPTNPVSQNQSQVFENTGVQK